METNKNKEIKKMPFLVNISIFFLFLFLIISIIGLLYHQQQELKRDFGCYISHVQECLNCHNQNLTYLLCSGFCVEPSKQDLDGKGCPVVNPIKDCFELPMMCNFP